MVLGLKLQTLWNSVEKIVGSIRADTFNTSIEICLPMTMHTAQKKKRGERWGGGKGCEVKWGGIQWAGDVLHTMGEN